MTEPRFATTPTHPGDEPLQLDSTQAQAIVRLLEAAPAVRRRYQFFVWSQSQLQPLVPHQLMVCGSYLRQRRCVVFDTFHSVVLSPEVLDAINDAEGPLAQALTAAWVGGQGQPVSVPLALLPANAAEHADRLRRELQWTHLVVHGVARPQRPTEIESLFIFGGPALAGRDAQRLSCLDLLLPQLHRTWQRVVSTEHDLMRPTLRPVEPPRADLADRATKHHRITPRECQILRWVRQGNSNQKIAEALLISPLTVKNHVQKILRKLGASNRAQAVAMAMDLGLLAEVPHVAERVPAPAPP